MQTLSNYIISFLIFFIISFILQQTLISKFRNWFLDYPDYRSSHNDPTPTSGGIIFVFIGTFGAIYYNFYIPLVCLPLSITGLFDDRFNVSRKLRYIVQIITVVILINFSTLEINSGNLFFQYFFKLFLIIAMTAIINFVNFMDGIDGLIAGSMIVYFIIFSLIISPSFIPLISSLIVFLLFNWHPAKVFMGDVGSTFLGALFAGSLLQTSNWTECIGCLMIASPILADSFICVIRRLINKENIFKPHRKHLYQRLIGQKGLSHAKVSLIYISASIICAFSINFLSIYFLIVNFILILILGIYLDKCIAKSFINSKLT